MPNPSPKSGWMFTAPSSVWIRVVIVASAVRPDTSRFHGSSGVNSGQPEAPMVVPPAPVLLDPPAPPRPPDPEPPVPGLPEPPAPPPPPVPGPTPPETPSQAASPTATTNRRALRMKVSFIGPPSYVRP